MHRQSAEGCRGTGGAEHECDVRSGRKLGTEAETEWVLSEKLKVKSEKSDSLLSEKLKVKSEKSFCLLSV